MPDPVSLRTSNVTATASGLSVCSGLTRLIHSHLPICESRTIPASPAGRDLAVKDDSDSFVMRVLLGF